MAANVTNCLREIGDIVDVREHQRDHVGGIERGKRNPSLLVMARIADALAVPLSKLVGE
jgi:hypothetical protein